MQSKRAPVLLAVVAVSAVLFTLGALRQLSPFKVTATIAVERRAADDAPAVSLAGEWGSDWGGVLIKGQGTLFTVHYLNGRGPFTGKFVGARRIDVDFSDDPLCCLGLVEEGNTIRWSNGTSWQRIAR